jgi:hypothetical protein
MESARNVRMFQAHVGRQVSAKLTHDACAGNPVPVIIRRCILKPDAPRALQLRALFVVRFLAFLAFVRESASAVLGLAAILICRFNGIDKGKYGK